MIKVQYNKHKGYKQGNQKRGYYRSTICFCSHFVLLSRWVLSEISFLNYWKCFYTLFIFPMVHCVSVLFLRNNIGQNTLKIHNPHFLICVTVFMKMLSRINIIITWNSKKRAAAVVSPWSGFIPLEILSFIWRWCSK